MFLKAKDIAGVNRAVKAVENLGGRVLHAFPPRVMAVEIPPGQIVKLKGQPGIEAVRKDAFPATAIEKADHELGLAMTAWNEHISADRRLRALESPTLSKSWDSPDLKPPDPPREILEKLRQREAILVPARLGARALAEGAPDMSIPVLVGRIAVGVVYVDSTVNQYKITNTEKLKVVIETTEGLNMLSGFEPRAGVNWFYNFKRPAISLAANQFTSANQDSWEDLWRDAAMGALGYTANIAGMKAYIQDIKNQYNADWAYALFVTKYPKFWFAYYWANHVVMDFAVDGWGIDNFNLVVAHETGHAFCCGDEYASSGCTCTSRHGRYQVLNGNCENCATNFVQCLMAHNSQAICDYSRGQLGWNELAVQSRGATTLKGTWTFDFDLGVQGPPTGADIWWEQVDNVTRFLVPQNGAMLAYLGKIDFDALSYQTLKTQSYTATPINGSNNNQNKLTAGTVIGIKTNQGRYAKMRVDQYGYNLKITWVTYK